MMRPFRREEGFAAPLPMANVDTDVIMPKQFLKTVNRDGLARGVMHDLRFAENDEPRPDFVLNRTPWTQARFLVVGPNFGCGSSREHAVWGLAQLGIRAIIGSSFAGIFFDNAARNGLLLVTLPESQVNMLLQHVADPATAGIMVDLERCVILADGLEPLAFKIEALRREQLLAGVDHIAATLEWAADIGRFETALATSEPWLDRQIS